MSERKRFHHYLPIFQLAHFAGPDGLIWVYDRAGKMNPNPKPIHPKVIGAEQELYTIAGDPTNPSDSLENWLASEIDGPASGVFPKLLAREQLDNK